MEKELAHAEIAQIAILKWAHEQGTSGNDREVKALLDLMNPKIFGKYSKLAEWYKDKWPETDSDFMHFLETEKLTKEWKEVFFDSVFTCSDPYREAKTLFRISLGNLANREDVLDVLKRYEEMVEQIEGLRIGAQARKSSGESVFTEMYEQIAERMEDDPSALSGYRTGFPILDKVTDGLRKWTVTRLNAYANTGKSKFSYHLTNQLLKQWAKVLYFSLEVGKKEVALNLSANWFGLDYYDISKGRVIPDFWEYPMQSINVIDDVRTMDDIETAVSRLKPDCCVIDYVQKIRISGQSEYDRMTEIATRMQDMAVRENVMVFDLSQVPNDGKDYVAGSIIPSKGSGELVAAADVGLVMTRNKKEKYLELHIAKNKFGRNQVAVYLHPDYSKSTFREDGEINASTF